MNSDIHSQIKFGTDGWRGVIADNFTFENVALVAQAISQWLKIHAQSKHQQSRVAVGYDTRFLSPEFAQTVACVLASQDIEVHLSDSPIPTPALSYGVVHLKCDSGVMISASHNPASFNGIKLKNTFGGGASREITDCVESYLGKTPVQKMDFVAAVAAKKIIIYDFKKSYLRFMKDYVDLKRIKNARFKVIQDVMHGSGNGLLKEILKGSHIRLSLMRDNINPSFGGSKPEPIAECLQEMMGRVKKERFDVGLALDGDADRIAAVAPGGEFVSPQRILGLLTLHLVRNRGCWGGVVKTICGSTIMDHIARKLKLKLFETPVGFKYISDLMVTENIVAGGEEAGGMGVQGYIPERDGILAGLLLIEMMAYQKKNIKELLRDMEKEFGRYYYVRSDLKLGEGRFDANAIKSTKEILGQKVVAIKDFDGVKLICANEDWLMLRPSGTEPLVRAYVEAKSLKRANELLDFGQRLLRKA